MAKFILFSTDADVKVCMTVSNIAGIVIPEPPPSGGNADDCSSIIHLADSLCLYFDSPRGIREFAVRRSTALRVRNKLNLLAAHPAVAAVEITGLLEIVMETERVFLPADSVLAVIHRGPKKVGQVYLKQKLLAKGDRLYDMCLEISAADAKAMVWQLTGVPLENETAPTRAITLPIDMEPLGEWDERY